MSITRKRTSRSWSIGTPRVRLPMSLKSPATRATPSEKPGGEMWVNTSILRIGPHWPRSGRGVRILPLRRGLRPLSLRSDREQLIVGAEEDLPIGNRRRRHQPRADIIAGDDLRGAAGSQHDGLARLADEVDLAVAGDRRGREDAVDALLPDAGAGLGVDDGDTAHVGGHVDQPGVVHQRRDVWRPGLRLPHDVRLADVAAAARSDGHVGAAAIPA